MVVSSRLRITQLTAGLLGFIQIATTFGVIVVRRSEKISMGDGQSRLLQRRIRGHGNLTENAPMGLLLIFLAERDGDRGIVLPGVMSALLLAGRALHATAFWNEKPWAFGRMGGMVCTLGAIGIGAVAAVSRALSAWQLDEVLSPAKMRPSNH